MSEGSHKRSTSPLSSEFSKKLRSGLADEVIDELNDHLRIWIGQLMQDPDTRPEDVTTLVLAMTCRQVVISLLNKTHLSIDKPWRDLDDCEARIDGLSPEDRLQLAFTWVEARINGEWEKFAIQSTLCYSYCLPQVIQVTLILRSLTSLGGAQMLYSSQ